MKHTILALALGLASTTAFADSYYKYEDVEVKSLSTDKGMEIRGSYGKSASMADMIESDNFSLGLKYVDSSNLIYKVSAEHKDIDISEGLDAMVELGMLESSDASAMDGVELESLMLSGAVGYNYEVGSSDIGVYGGVYSIDLEAEGYEVGDMNDFFVGVSADIPLLDDDVSLDLYAEHYNDMDESLILDNLRYGADINVKISSNVDAFVGLESFGSIETMKAGVALKF